MINILKISQVSKITINSTRQLATFKDIFSSKDKKESVEVQTQKENLISSDFDAIKKTETTRLTRVKAYKPPSNVEETIKNVCKENFGNNYNEENLKDLSLSDPNIKFNVLSKCVSIFKHNIPNPLLNEINNVGNLIQYYLREQKDTSPLEDLYQQQDLPKNLHINLEYNRFDPEKDEFFNGRDAFPERNTIVTSLWYSKKYKSVYKKKPHFSK